MEHFTAWLTNDPTCLEGDCCDVVVLRDEVIGYETDRNGFETDTPNWASTGDPLMRAMTTVDAREGNWDEATAEAVALLEERGWRVAGTWGRVPTGGVVTVERADA